MRSGKKLVILSIIAVLCGLFLVQQQSKIEPEKVVWDKIQTQADNRVEISERSRYKQDIELKHSTQRDRVFFFGGIFALFSMAYFFPRFAMYVAGPGILITTVGAIFADKGLATILFSPAGNGWAGLIKLFIWIMVLLVLSLGVALIAFAKASLRKKQENYIDNPSD